MDARNPPQPATELCVKPALLHRDELRSILSNLSHELCRPLISLRAGFDLLLEPSEAEIGRGQKKHLLTMVSLCDDLLQLTHSYLDFANLVQGTRPIAWGTFSLGALFAEIESQFAPLASRRGIEWEMCPDDPEATIRTDASRCQQILGNLASNALKHTPAGGSVKIHGHAKPDAWSVSVVDTGAGIPPEAIAKVFEPFYRLDRDQYADVEGNGLGLTICRELVEQLHGEIVLESIVEQGTTVTVRFPLDPKAATTTGPRAQERSKPRRRTRSQAPPAPESRSLA